MRSYHSHVAQLLSGPPKQTLRKPCFRSSAIFPVEHRPPGIRTRLTFMGYWFLKRHVKEVSVLATLRSSSGEVLHRYTQVIRDAKVYCIEAEEMLEAAGFPIDQEFHGSIEAEFFSAVDMMFPYPAVVVNYYGPQFSSAVHSSQRVYNDHEDMDLNSEQLVPESGFNIYADEDREPFFYLINGPEAVPNCILDMEFYNQDHEELQHQLKLGRLEPYEERAIYPDRELDLASFLKGQVGAAKISYELNWIYPRLITGNLQKSLSATVITHTYYDCSDAKTTDDYWKDCPEDWHPAALNIPVSIAGERYTNAYFYPLLSPCVLEVDVEIFDAQGQLLGEKERVLTVRSPCKEALHIPFKEVCAELELPSEKVSSARIIARPIEGTKLPARIKLGYDLGLNPEQLPCNICTNLWPCNPDLENKPRCFRWGPILSDQSEATIWLLNGSAMIDYQREAEVHLLFHREQDTRMLERSYILAPNGSLEIRLSEDEALRDFLQGRVGWYSATSTNPYLTTYYFCEHASGIVGGDHGF